MGERSQLKVWVADPLVKVLRTTPVPSKAQTVVKVDAARNEYESAQVVVTSAPGIKSLRVSASKLEGPSGVAPRVSAAFLGFIPVAKGSAEVPAELLIAKAPIDVPDPILETKSVEVKPGASQPIWLTIYVPKRATPGSYTGTISVQADSITSEIPISVTVHPVTVPDERTLYVTNWFFTDKIAAGHGIEKWSEPFWKMLESYAAFMADHRQNVVLTPILELITAKDDGSGNLTFDFAKFDRWVGLFRNAGLTTIEGGHLAWRSEWEAKEFTGSPMTTTGPDGSVLPLPGVPVSSDVERKFLAQFLPVFQKHLDEKGWLQDYRQHLADEPLACNAESYKKLSSYVREYAPGFRIIDACQCKEIAGAIDIWVPLTSEYEQDLKFFQGRQRKGDEGWFYTCLVPKGKYMNRFLDQHLLGTRLLHWANFKYGATGYLHWGFNHWSADPFGDPEADWGGGSFLPPGDSNIAYPGKHGLISSIRMEALRDGLEDYELLKIVAAKDPKKAKSICDSVIKTMTDYTVDPGVFRRARLRLLEAAGDD